VNCFWRSFHAYVDRTIDSAPLIEVRRAGIRERERPATAVRLRPVNGRLHVSFQVENRILSTEVRKARMAATGDQVQHDRSWTEVERNALPDSQAGSVRPLVTRRAVISVIPIVGPTPWRPAMISSQHRHPSAMTDVRRST
jgi:hypothetical protein